MGRDFSIGCSDSTCKGVSHIMFQMVKLASQIKDGVDIDDIPHEDKHISIEQLAIIIQSLKNDLTSVYYNSDLKTKFVEGYKFYDSDTFEEVYENCETARDLFVDALVDSILNEKEEKIMFHTLGYDYQPRWNDDRGGYRNWFGVYPSEDNGDYKAIKSLVEKGYMQKDGVTAWNEEVYSVTNKGNAYVVNLWFKKKKENKPSRSKRRYQAYLDWCDWNDGTFKEFLDWLKITEKDELYYPEECEVIREYKKRWRI